MCMTLYGLLKGRVQQGHVLLVLLKQRKKNGNVANHRFFLLLVELPKVVIYIYSKDGGLINDINIL